jgi:hypothetical protein
MPKPAPKSIQNFLSLDFRISYNTCLFNYVDKLSLWSTFTSPDHREYWETAYRFTEKDREQVKKYQKTRQQFHWDETAALFAWAYQGFPESDKYSALLPVIRYFESREDKKGLTLKTEVEQAVSQVKKAKVEILKEITDPKIVTAITKGAELFQVELTDSPIICYLIFSPVHDMQGGANGPAITVEIPINDPHYLKRVIPFIFHEAFHLKTRIYENSLLNSNPQTKTYFRQYVTSLSQENLGGFFDEVVTYLFIDLYCFGENPEETIRYYETIQRKGEEDYGISVVPIWKAALALKPIIDEYLAGKLTAAKTRQRLFSGFREFVTKY